jgi:integrase/recombinase XerD
MLAAALADEAWSGVAVWLMMRLGLTRAELLALQRDHIDRTDAERPIVHIYYDDVAKQGKERKLAADEEFSVMYDAFLDARDPQGVLFPVGRQAVNGMVERVRRAAGIEKEITPTTLRQTFAIEEARKGAKEDRLLALLGLADDPRNRATVRGYIAHAAPPVNEPVPDGTAPEASTSGDEEP